MIKRITEPELDAQREYSARVLEIIRQNGAAPRACVVTYGCQQNEADSERLSGMLVEMGYIPTSDPESADLILSNTCAVREHAEERALSITGQYKHLKEKNPALIIGVCGCMVSQEHRQKDIKFKYPYVDFAFGTSYLYRLPEIIYTALTEKKRRFRLDCGDEGNIAEGLPVNRACRHRAWLSVMYGCNNFCSYCVVPYVRGRERSRYKEEILKEAGELAESGARDITLLGQNVNSYGGGLYDDYRFPQLLRDVNAVPGDFTIHFMTSHPKDASRELIDAMADCEKVARHLHLPLQSGSEEVLKRMNRRYTTGSYLELLSYARERMPGLTVSTDIIVGFPGESEEAFEKTLDALRAVRYDMVYSFIYSPRVGTPAALFPEQIPDEVKGERFRRLLDLQTQISLENNEALVGKKLRVLCDGKAKTGEGMYSGRTDGGKIVCFETPVPPGEFRTAEITSAAPFTLFGRIAEQS